MHRKSERLIMAHMGRRLRLLRLLRGFSQNDLARGMGLTFQQVQKYERGRNTIAASRLHRMAGLLGVAPEVFFEGLDDDFAPDRLEDLTTAFDRISPQFGARELVELNRAFARISDPAIRRDLLTLMERLADSPPAGSVARSDAHHREHGSCS